MVIRCVIMAALSYFSKSPKNIPNSIGIHHKLPNGYSFVCDSSEDFDKFKVYSSCKIAHNNLNILKFDSMTEFEVTRGYPEGISHSGIYSLNLYLNDRPLRDKIVSISIKNNRVMKIDTLPLFPMYPFSIDSTHIDYVAWIRDLYEISDNKIPYSPVLFYRCDSGSFIFDKDLTKSVNAKIYGKYYGAQYSEKHEFPLNSVGKLLDNVLDSLDCTKNNRIRCRE